MAAEERCDLVVVGAGLAALHLVSRLPDSLLKNTVVVDSGEAGSGWLAGWRQRQAALAAPHVRTLVMQHPHAEPLALQAYVEKQGRQQDLTPVVKGFAPVPSLGLFLDFCTSKVVGKLPAGLREPQKERVVRIEQLEGEEGRGCRVHLASGKVLLASAAVYTPANRQPVVPAWARRLAVADAPNTPAAAGDGNGCASPVAEEAARLMAGQGGSAEMPAKLRLPPGIVTSDAVDLRAAELAGSRVVVVGGGMSAGLLAAGAAERGAQVTLVCRRPLVPQPFETEVGWWGAKQLNQFGQVESPALRWKACQRARKQGTVHLPVWRRLVQQAAAGRLTVLEGWEVEAAEQVAGEAGQAWKLTVRRSEAGPVPRKQAGAPSLFQQALAATLAGGASGNAAEGGADGEAATEGSAETAAEAAVEAGKDPSPGGSQPGQPDPPQQAQQAQQRQLAADRVWLACGRAYDAASDPVLSRLLADRPTLLIGGYPVLDDEHLCWPGAAVYVAGRGAMLSVGPSAGDMPGMRIAAGRVAASLRRLDFADDPVWLSVQQRLLARLLKLTDTGSGSLQSSAADSKGATGKQLAAAVAAAAFALPALPLEAEGRMWVEEKPKALVSKPDHLIDVSDLDPALPRRELAQYKFTDDEFEICVICQLGEAVPLDQVRVLFGERHLEMWAVGQAAAYHLHVPRLYGRVITGKCRVKVNQKAKKVFLLLQKESDAEWRFLKS